MSTISRHHHLYLDSAFTLRDSYPPRLLLAVHIQSPMGVLVGTLVEHSSNTVLVGNIRDARESLRTAREAVPLQSGTHQFPLGGQK